MASLSAIIEKLREVNEPVPKPMRLPTDVEVAAVERELDVKFHADFRRYLLEASDVTYGALEPVTITEPSAHTHLPDVANDAWELGVEKNLLPICEDNGDYYCIDAKGRVKYWSHNGTTDEDWPNLATWIEQVWLEGEMDSEDDEDDE